MVILNIIQLGHSAFILCSKPALQSLGRLLWPSLYFMIVNQGSPEGEKKYFPHLSLSLSLSLSLRDWLILRHWLT